MGVKMNSRIITKNHAADPEIGFLTKSISKPYSRATGHADSVGDKVFFLFCESQNWLQSGQRCIIIYQASIEANMRTRVEVNRKI